MKRNIFIIGLTIIGLACIAPQSAYSQDEEPLTEYEKGRVAVAYKTIEKISTMFDKYGYSGEAALQRAYVLQMLKNKDLSSPRAVMESMEEVINTLCGVTAFMPGENLKEMYYTGQYRSICEEYAEELMQLDQSISAEDLAFEKEKVKKRAMANNIERQVKRDFIVWNKKGEYEKTIDYEKRLQQNSEWAFDSICQKAIEDHWQDNLRFHVYEYDADNEILPIKLWHGDKEGNELCSVMYNVFVSPNWVKILKERMFKECHFMAEGIYKGYLFPTKILLTPRDYDRRRNDYIPEGYFICSATTEGIEPLVIDFDNLKIENKYLSGIKRNASFEAFYEYKKALQDSIKIYNQLLQQHPLFYSNKIYENRVTHTKTVVSEYNNRSNNTQIDINTINIFTGRIGITSSNYRTPNLINPSQEAYYDFAKALRLFYDECVKHFDATDISKLAAREENKAYIALLMKNQKLNKAYQSEIHKYFSSSELRKMIKYYPEEQLQYVARNHSKYFEKYAL